jgi:formate dehydrogenase subunit gamma
VVITILLVELVVLVLVLLNILPTHVFQIYPDANYANYVQPDDVTKTAVVFTKWFFFLLTAGVLLPLILIIFMEIIRRIINSRREAREGRPARPLPLPSPPTSKTDRVQGEYIKRFDVQQRIQHLVLLSTFIILALTGIPRGFPDWPLAQWWTNLLGGPGVLRLIHDIAAFTMVADGIYHLAYIAYGKIRKHTFPWGIVPNFNDMLDMLHTFLWIFGKYKDEPEYDRFTYGQKIDYWAIFWGLPVMVISGIFMMFPAFFEGRVSSEFLAICAVAHRDESILAVGFIIIVHLYYGHLQRNVFPMNTVMFTGKMLKSKYKQWFARDYNKIISKE